MNLVIQLVIKNLNVSMQVGDAIYATPSLSLLDNINSSATAGVNVNNLVGILRKIDNTGGNNYDLYVDDNGYNAVVSQNDFIMFSKYDQSDGDIKGYYMEVQFINNSREKAELFSVSSEVTQSSK